MISITPTFFIEPIPIRFSFGVGCRNGTELMADEGFVGIVEKGVDFAKRVSVVDDEDKFCIHACTACGTCNHVASQDFTKVPDVKLTAGRNAGSDDVLVASLSEPFGHHVAPVHDAHLRQRQLGRDRAAAHRQFRCVWFCSPRRWRGQPRRQQHGWIQWFSTSSFPKRERRQ